MKQQAHKKDKIVLWFVGWFILFSNLSLTAYAQTVTLAWSPSSNPHISHYAVYRKTTEDTNFSLIGTIIHPDTIYIDQSLSWGLHYFYVATSIDIYENESGYSNMIDTTLSLVPDNEKYSQPDKYALYQNYPNPFNSSTNIVYNLPVDADVKISVYNIRGKKIRELVHKYKNAGLYSIQWDGCADSGETVAAGSYYYRFETLGFSDVKKMLLLK